MPAGIPPELMKMLGGAGGAPGGGAPGAPAGGGMPPVSAPMSTPQPNDGEKQAAKVKVQQAMDLLEQTLPELGSESEEGAAVLQVPGAIPAGVTMLPPLAALTVIAAAQGSTKRASCQKWQ